MERLPVKYQANMRRLRAASVAAAEAALERAHHRSEEWDNDPRWADRDTRWSTADEED